MKNLRGLAGVKFLSVLNSSCIFVVIPSGRSGVKESRSKNGPFCNGLSRLRLTDNCVISVPPASP